MLATPRAKKKASLVNHPASLPVFGRTLSCFDATGALAFFFSEVAEVAAPLRRLTWESPDMI